MLRVDRRWQRAFGRLSAVFDGYCGGSDRILAAFGRILVVFDDLRGQVSVMPHVDDEGEMMRVSVISHQ